MATVLCSLLIGVGYNAFVVVGYAPPAVTLNDQQKMGCPVLEREQKGEGTGGGAAAQPVAAKATSMRKGAAEEKVGKGLAINGFFGDKSGCRVFHWLRSSGGAVRISAHVMARQHLDFEGLWKPALWAVSCQLSWQLW